jgi:hypothetical protein
MATDIRLKSTITFGHIASQFPLLWLDCLEDYPQVEYHLQSLCTNRLLLSHLRLGAPADESALENFIKLNLIVLWVCFDNEALDYLLNNFPDATLMAVIRVVKEGQSALHVEHAFYKPVMVHVAADVLVESSVGMGEALNTELFEILNIPEDVKTFVETHLNRPHIQLH